MGELWVMLMFWAWFKAIIKYWVLGYDVVLVHFRQGSVCSHPSFVHDLGVSDFVLFHLLFSRRGVLRVRHEVCRHQRAARIVTVFARFLLEIVRAVLFSHW